MKFKLITIILLLITVSLLGINAENDKIFKQGVNFYTHNQFKEALKNFIQLEKKGIINADLYYNIGNTYFRLNRLGLAILYYKKALKVKPDFAQAKKNLEFAISLTKDKQTYNTASPIEQKLKSIFDSLSMNLSAIITLILFAFVVFIIIVIILFYKDKEKAAIIFTLVILLMLFASSLLVSYLKWQSYHNDKEAVLISESAIGFSGPGDNYTRVFTIHEGMIFDVEQTQGDWTLVKLKNGLGGWIRTQDLKRVKILANK
jgi:tetratricopeptide (TPR) repeat protein